MEAPTLESVAEEVAQLRRRLAAMERASGLFATNKELDGPNGDPVVKFPPRVWRGPDFTNKKFSACTPAFLDLLAESLQWSADNPKAGREQYVKYNRLDAKRARSWARRLRAGATEATPEAPKRQERGTGRETRERAAPRARTAGRAPMTEPTPQPEEDDEDFLGLGKD
jgi:hypothetical protein